MINSIKIEHTESGDDSVTLNDGSTYEGEFKNDQPHGYGIMIWSEFKNPNFFKYEGEWKNGVMHGKGCLLLRAGDTYEGYFINGLIEGGTIIYFNDGSNYEGNLVNGQIEGKGKMTYSTNGEFYVYEGEFKQNERHGVGKYSAKEGNIEGVWKNDQRVITNKITIY